MTPVDPVDLTLLDISAGKPVIVEDTDEGHGVLVVAAASAVAENIAFLVRHTSGILGVAVSEDTADRLRLPLINELDSSRSGLRYTETVDAATGVGTGISAADRARTMRVLADPASRASDLTRPGHVMPIRVTGGGGGGGGGVGGGQRLDDAVLNLVTAAGVGRAAVLASVVSETQPTELATAADLRAFADRFGLRLTSTMDLARYRLRTDAVVRRVASTRLPLSAGVFRAIGFQRLDVVGEYLALVYGDVAGYDQVPTYLHRECPAGDIFGSLGCECSNRLQAALKSVVARGSGVVVYLPAASRGDDRVISQILHDLGLRSAIETLAKPA